MTECHKTVHSIQEYEFKLKKIQVITDYRVTELGMVLVRLFYKN
jgi:hypothetical protein